MLLRKRVLVKKKKQNKTKQFPEFITGRQVHNTMVRTKDTALKVTSGKQGKSNRK